MHIFNKILNSPQIIIDYNPYKIETNRRALVLFKTDWFGPFGKRSINTGTTQFEVSEATRILNKLGYLVTIVDRGYKCTLIHKYDLFYGLVIGGSGQYFKHYFEQMPTDCIKIALSTGPNSQVASKKIKERTRYFKERHGVVPISMPRTTPESFNQLIENCNALFYHGNDIVRKGYEDIHIPKFKLPTPIKDNIRITFNKLGNKHGYKNNFLFYSGSGMISKGLDIILDSFLELEDYNLFIATLSNENNFFDFYKEKIQKADNIKYLNSMESDSLAMMKISSKCAFVISASCNDGDPAAIMECLRYGLVPVVTRETDIAFKEALIFQDFSIPNIKKCIKRAANLNEGIYTNLSKKSYLASLKNYSSNYTLAIEEAFCSTIIQEGEKLFNKIEKKI